VGGENRRQKSLRIGVHHANAVVWGPVYRTHHVREKPVIRVRRPRDRRGDVLLRADRSLHEARSAVVVVRARRREVPEELREPFLLRMHGEKRARAARRRRRRRFIRRGRGRPSRARVVAAEEGGALAADRAGDGAGRRERARRADARGVRDARGVARGGRGHGVELLCRRPRRIAGLFATSRRRRPALE